MNVWESSIMTNRFNSFEESCELAQLMLNGIYGSG